MQQLQSRIVLVFLCFLIADKLTAEDTAYATKIRPLLDRYCVGCHSGDKPKGKLDLAAEPANIDTLEHLGKRLRGQTMPPPKSPQPNPTERAVVLSWTDTRIDALLGNVRNPGRVTIRRLTKVDYRNTIRDLLGIEVDTSEFPSDDVAHGFDNLAEVISLPPLLLEQYLDAAESIAKRWFEQHIGKDVAKWPTPERPGKQLAQTILFPIMERAFRRPLRESERDGLLRFYESCEASGFGYEGAMQASLQKILISPHFLFRIEQDGPIGQNRPLDEFELATRLSYFLWATLPDDELLGLARAGNLRQGTNLERQARRMLRDPKVRQGLVENFAGQWLQVRRLEAIRPDKKLFPHFDDPLRAAMAEETYRVFKHIVREDQPIAQLLEADYTFVNDRLAKHYGLADVKGDHFRKVPLTGPRRGVLTHASVLAINAHPTRTSPVLRGKWILEAILGTPPPPPVADAGSLEAVTVRGTLRQRLQAHRENPRCASCHAPMDALGLAFENYDSLGRWRTKDGGFAIDASGELPDGSSFDNARELIALLAKNRRDDFRKSLAEQMLVYALGRKLERYDRSTVRRIVTQTASSEDRFSALVLAIVGSDAFQQRHNFGRIGLAKLPASLRYDLTGNPAQQMVLKLSKRPEAKPYTQPRVAFELHTLAPLLRAVTTTGQSVQVGQPTGGEGKQAYRYPIDAPFGQPLQLLFMKGLIGPLDVSDDFLMPVQSIPDTDSNQVFRLATWDQRWGASLKGPNNPKPGTVYSFDFDVRLVAKERDQVDVWINIGGAHNRSVFNAGRGYKVEGEGTHRLTRVGRRSLDMGGAWARDISVLIRARPQTVVSNLSPIRFVRPQLGISDDSPIDLGTIAKNAPIASKIRHVFNAQKTVLTDHEKTAWPTLLFGTARLKGIDPKRPYAIETQHVGIELVGKDSARFELLGEHAVEKGSAISLIGNDEKPGLTGGTSPEREPFQVRFRGASEAGTFEANVRIVTQAGGVGELSQGKQGEPTKGLYYVDVPVRVKVQ